MTTTAANANDLTEIDRPLYGDEKKVIADTDYTGVQKRVERKLKSPCPGKRGEVK